MDPKYYAYWMWLNTLILIIIWSNDDVVSDAKGDQLIPIFGSFPRTYRDHQLHLHDLLKLIGDV